ncbi:hypothetical protein [Gluconacetobacter sp.]|uniref:hypothetical protein n=1 Tax=Gluconacetobacter sp. TaxID=1935994 RepID=UPI0039EC0C05
MQEPILRYAEAIQPSFGGDLADDGHIMFTCSGSEANNLALRYTLFQYARRQFGGDCGCVGDA